MGWSGHCSPKLTLHRGGSERPAGGAGEGAQEGACEPTAPFGRTHHPAFPLPHTPTWGQVGGLPLTKHHILPRGEQ